MSCSTAITVAFKSPAQQQEFASFKLADGLDVSISQLPVEAIAAAAAGQASSTGADSSSSSGSSSSCFRQQEFFKHLTSRRMGHTLLTTASIPSTQEFMRAQSMVLPEGAVLVADQQSRGKGRGGNVWTSPDGCLMFTALRRLQVPGTQAAFINYVVCLAVVRGIKQATQHLVQGGLDVQIKWPNDIYYSGVKIGGALIHTTWTASKFSVLTGIGLNVSNSQPTTCLDDVIASLQQQQQQQQQPAAKVNKEQLLAAVLTHLEACFDQFETQGFAPLEPQYLASWMHSNQQVELEEGLAEPAGSSGLGGGSDAAQQQQQQQQQRVTLKIVGLSPFGFLLAVDAAGQRFELTPDGNSLDMMQGLIRKKLN
ncbi:hypothetical protein OEZ86_004707 [Tetradesmus obliquus]|nr:hypothetical protein OEZ86_004707 [Tetradesmus obliquus]